MLPTIRFDSHTLTDMREIEPEPTNLVLLFDFVWSPTG
jgi:hypothetical protein